MSGIDEAQPTLNRSGDCELTGRDRTVRLRDTEIDTFFSYMDLPQTAGWLSGRRYFLFGQQGIQVSTASSTCGPGYPATLWTWNYIGWESQIRYPTFRRPLLRTSGGGAEVLLASDRGFWNTRVRFDSPWTWRRAVHWSVHHHVVWLGWLLLGLWLLRRRRDGNEPVKPPRATAIAPTGSED